MEFRAKARDHFYQSQFGREMMDVLQDREASRDLDRLLIFRRAIDSWQHEREHEFWDSQFGQYLTEELAARAERTYWSKNGPQLMAARPQSLRDVYIGNLIFRKKYLTRLEELEVRRPGDRPEPEQRGDQHQQGEDRRPEPLQGMTQGRSPNDGDCCKRLRSEEGPNGGNGSSIQVRHLPDRFDARTLAC